MGCAGSKTSPSSIASHPHAPTQSVPPNTSHQQQLRVQTFRDRRCSAGRSWVTNERTNERRLSISQQLEDETAAAQHGPSGEELPQLQCPICTGAFATLSGLKPVPGGMVAKVNQDRGLVVHPWCGHPSSALFGVYDGHGRRGHEVSEFFVQRLPHVLQQVQASGEPDLGEVLGESYVLVDEALRHAVDATVSGTTAITCLLNENDLLIAGDSRAMVCRRHDSSRAFRPKQLISPSTISRTCLKRWHASYIWAAPSRLPVPTADLHACGMADEVLPCRDPSATMQLQRSV